MIGADLWALCWSQDQGALHIETIGEHMAENLDALIANRPGDYRLVHVGTRAEVDAAAADLRQALSARRDARAHLPAASPKSDPNHAEAAC